MSRATWANSPAAGDGVPPKNTPSPTALAAATPFGPAAATRIGTSIGRAGAKPAGCIMRITRAVPGHLLAAQERAQRLDVGGDVAPALRLLAEAAGAGEPGPDGHRDPTRRQVDQGGDGGGVGHDVAQVGHEHARARARSTTSGWRPRARVTHTSVYRAGES